MPQDKDKNTYVTIPNKGDHDLTDLLETLYHLRRLTWTFSNWTPTPALIDKSGGSSRQYIGQNFDPKYFDLVEDGWTHDHCEICSRVISNIQGYGDTEGYKGDNGEWICKECYNLFIKPIDVQETIKSLKKVNK